MCVCEYRKLCNVLHHTLFAGVHGADGDGNVFCPDNITEFSHYVLDQTRSLGVHFMMADGVSIYPYIRSIVFFKFL